MAKRGRPPRQISPSKSILHPDRQHELVGKLEIEAEAVAERIEDLHEELEALERAKRGLRGAIAALNGEVPPKSGAKAHADSGPTNARSRRRMILEKRGAGAGGSGGGGSDSNGGGGGSRGGRVRGGSGRGGGVDGEQAAAWIVELLESERELSAGELRSRIAERAVAAGRSRQGLHLVIGRALGKARFVEEQGKFRLADK